jgi:hypothetical protein
MVGKATQQENKNPSTLIRIKERGKVEETMSFLPHPISTLKEEA